MFKILSKKAYNAILEERDDAIRIEAKTFNALAARKNEIEILNVVIAKRDDKVKELQAAIAEKDELYVQQQKELFELHLQLEAKNQELAEQRDISKGVTSTVGELKRENAALRKRIVKLQKETQKSTENVEKQKKQQ